LSHSMMAKLCIPLERIKAGRLCKYNILYLSVVYFFDLVA
jgi:hypothetical protein